MHGHRAGADVIGDAPQAAANVAFVFVVHAADFRGGQHDRFQIVDVEIRLYALQRGGRAFQAHAGVNVFAGERAKVVRRVADAIELREDQIPNLDRLTAGGMVIDFAARAAGRRQGPR